MSTRTWKKCPHCGYTFESYSTYTKNYKDHSGHPFKFCPKCSEIIIDKDMKEPALKPPPKRPSIFSCFFTGFMPFGLLGILCSIPMFTDETFNIFETNNLLYFLILVMLPAAVWICMIIWAFCSRDKIKIELDKEYEDSEKRLQNREYALLLKELGYKVPEKYLK